MESNSNMFTRCQENFYPVDLKCKDYKELNPDHYLSSLQSETMFFSLPNGEQVKVIQGNISQLMLFGDNDPLHCLLALHKPGDETKVVALYLHGKWWSTSDVLKTSSTSRNGLVFVESVMERVILFLLSQIVFGIFERPREAQMYFSAPPIWENGKILWQDGEAVGFYTIKKKGSLCDGCTGQSYHLPVLDTVFVRSHWRRRGLAFQMLQDFCTSMPSEKVLGISYPISPSMYGGRMQDTNPQPLGLVASISVALLEFGTFINVIVEPQEYNLSLLVKQKTMDSIVIYSQYKQPNLVVNTDFFSKFKKSGGQLTCSTRGEVTGDNTLLKRSPWFTTKVVCRKYLETHREERERLYEVEAPGEWHQRRNVWLNLLLQPHPAHRVNSGESPHSQLKATGTKQKVPVGKSKVVATSPEPERPQKRTNTGATPANYKKVKTSL